MKKDEVITNSNLSLMNNPDPKNYISDFQVHNTNLRISNYDLDAIPIHSKNHDIYEVVFESSILKDSSKYIYLIDENIYIKHTNLFIDLKSPILKLKITEQFKTLENVETILNFLSTQNTSKECKLIVIGGGITQDICGFAAACYKRGIRWIYYPTTLLAMSDSCIGGKVSLNFNQAKNQLGLFNTPGKIIIDTHFLTTLSSQDLMSGLGEILKSCILGGEQLLALYESHVANQEIYSIDYKPLIHASLSVKKAIIEHDEFEYHERKALNYGHTIGHATEAFCDYSIPHGICVVIGMLLENEISHKEKLLSFNSKEKVNQLCRPLLSDSTLEILQGINIHEFVTRLPKLLLKDKKSVGDSVTFILLEKPGHVVFKNIQINSHLIDCIQDAFLNLFIAESDRVRPQRASIF